MKKIAPITTMLSVILSSFIPIVRVLFGASGSCKYTVTCTRFAQWQLQTFPFHRALWSIIRRLLSCW